MARSNETDEIAGSCRVHLSDRKLINKNKKKCLPFSVDRPVVHRPADEAAPGPWAEQK